MHRTGLLRNLTEGREHRFVTSRVLVSDNEFELLWVQPSVNQIVQKALPVCRTL
jgi:hypothetical protein